MIYHIVQFLVEEILMDLVITCEVIIQAFINTLKGNGALIKFAKLFFSKFMDGLILPKFTPPKLCA